MASSSDAMMESTILPAKRTKKEAISSGSNLPHSPARAYNQAIEAAKLATMAVIEEVGDEAMYPLAIKIVSRLHDLRRSTWIRRPRQPL